jgi:hypothetical protein
MKFGYNLGVRKEFVLTSRKQISRTSALGKNLNLANLKKAMENEQRDAWHG